MTIAEKFFKAPNAIFVLGLDPYEVAVYCYLLSCAGAKGECWPSVGTIAHTLSISENTVMKRLELLIEKRLITKTATSHVTKSGKPRTSNNRYRILEIGRAVARHIAIERAKTEAAKPDLPL